MGQLVQVKLGEYRPVLWVDANAVAINRHDIVDFRGGKKSRIRQGRLRPEARPVQARLRLQQARSSVWPAMVIYGRWSITRSNQPNR